MLLIWYFDMIDMIQLILWLDATRWMLSDLLQLVELLIEPVLVTGVGGQRSLLLLLQLFNSSRCLRQQLVLTGQRLFQRLVLHFQLDVVLHYIGGISATQGFAHTLLQQEDVQLQVEVLMLKLLQLLFVLLDTAPSRRWRLARRTFRICIKVCHNNVG